MSLPVVSVDFDETLQHSVATMDLSAPVPTITVERYPNHDTIKAVQQFDNGKCEVWVVTAREYSPESLAEIRSFLDKWGLSSIVQAIHHTEGELKGTFFKQRQIVPVIHFDDKQVELDALPEGTIPYLAAPFGKHNE